MPERQRYACKKDERHKDVARWFQCYGWEVIDTTPAPGLLLDIIVIRGARPARTVLFIEVKNGPSFALTAHEVNFIDAHSGACFIVWNREQVEALTQKFGR